MYNVKYPVAFHPVDMAITRIHEGRIQVLLAQKVKDTEGGANVWRFPGGFLDVCDSCAEEAALRESMEETGMKFGNSAMADYFVSYFAKKKPLTDKLNKLIETNGDSKEITETINQLHEIKISEDGLTWLRSRAGYIGSTKIDDVRYKDTDHKVITSFYELHPNPKFDKAGEGPFDDIARTKWFFLSEIKEEIMHKSHVPLFNMLFDKYKAEKIADQVFEHADQMAKEVEDMFKGFKKSTEEIFESIENKIPDIEKKTKETMDKMNARFESMGDMFKNFFKD